MTEKLRRLSEPLSAEELADTPPPPALLAAREQREEPRDELAELRAYRARRDKEDERAAFIKEMNDNRKKVNDQVGYVIITLVFASFGLTAAFGAFVGNSPGAYIAAAVFGLIAACPLIFDRDTLFYKDKFPTGQS